MIWYEVFKRRIGMSKIHNHVSIDYYAYISNLRVWNTYFKVIFSLIALTIVITADSIWISIATLIFMMGLTVGVGKIKLTDYLRVLWIPATFIILSGLAIAIQFSDKSDALLIIHLFAIPVSISMSNLVIAIGVALKAFGAMSAVYMMTLSTPMGEIISVFRKLHVPVLILELMHLIYRYIFIMSDINQKQKDATRSRLGYCDLKTSFRTFSSEMANLLILSLKKADVYYDAMEARGYEGTCLFWEEKKALTMNQLCYGILYGGVVLTVYILRRNYG